VYPFLTIYPPFYWFLFSNIITGPVFGGQVNYPTTFPDAVARNLIAESEIKIIDIGTSLIEGCTETIVKVNYKSQLLNFIGKVEQFASRLFGLELHANKNCNSCGICWNNCPGNNIKCSINGMPKFGFNCLMCM